MTAGRAGSTLAQGSLRPTPHTGPLALRGLSLRHGSFQTQTPGVFLTLSQYLEILEPLKCVTVPGSQRG